MNEPSEEKPKIVVDTDWKAQVEAEKEQLRRQEHHEPSATSAPDESARQATPKQDAEPPLPPASFEWLVTSLATQAMVSLGQIPDPLENKSVVRLSHARHYIDLLSMLEEKTKGNLRAEEQALLTHVLTDLRMAYVAVETRAKGKRA